jgi:hypothetical protein
VQTKISDLLDDLKSWSKAVLLTNPEVEHVGLEGSSYREQFILEMNYWSTKILITRPCLYRLERRNQTQRNASVESDTKTAEACVAAALEIVKLFPDQPDAESIYSKGPWWEIIHISQYIPRVELTTYPDHSCF